MITMKKSTYTVLKWIAQVVLPAVTTFYGVVATSCNLPHTKEVLTIAIAFDTMLGTILGVSTKDKNTSTEEVIKELETEKAEETKQKEDATKNISTDNFVVMNEKPTINNDFEVIDNLEDLKTEIHRGKIN